MTNRELVSYVREQFPALKNQFNGFPLAYLDGPGGYQVPMRVIQAMENHLVHTCANSEVPIVRASSMMKWIPLAGATINEGFS